MPDEPVKADLPHLEPSVAALFASGAELDRLTRAPLEFERSKAILRERLPRSGRVLDVGGGPGLYASWLAGQGYQVDLVEPVPLHIDHARKLATSGAHFDVHFGDARRLPFPDGAADAVLLLGPLYYLVEAGERATVLSEAFRVLRPGGVLVAAALGRLMPLLQAVAQNSIRRPGGIDAVLSAIKSGVVPSGPVLLYTHRPAELFAEVAAAGYTDVKVLAVTGSFLGVPNVTERLADPASKEALLSVLREVEQDPGIVGISGKLMAVARRPGDATERASLHGSPTDGN